MPSTHKPNYHQLSTDTKSCFSFSKICLIKVIKRWVRWYSKMFSILLQGGLDPVAMSRPQAHSGGAGQWGCAGIKTFPLHNVHLEFLLALFFFLIFSVIMTRVSLPVIHSVLAPTAKGLGKNLRPSRSAAENMTRTEDFQREETGLSVRSLSPGKATIPELRTGWWLGGGLKAETRILSCQRWRHFEAWINYWVSSEGGDEGEGPTGPLPQHAHHALQLTQQHLYIVLSSISERDWQRSQKYT